MSSFTCFKPKKKQPSEFCLAPQRESRGATAAPASKKKKRNSHRPTKVEQNPVKSSNSPSIIGATPTTTTPTPKAQRNTFSALTFDKKIWPTEQQCGGYNVGQCLANPPPRCWHLTMPQRGSSNIEEALSHTVEVEELKKEISSQENDDIKSWEFSNLRPGSTPMSNTTTGCGMKRTNKDASWKSVKEARFGGLIW